MVRGLASIVLLAAALVNVAPAAASDWLPHGPDATWSYAWTDSVYNKVTTVEKVTVKDTQGAAFTLAWTTEGQGNAADAPVSVGTVSFQDSPAGILNTDWSSNPPPAGFPILCGTISGCGNSLASTYYNLIWGTRVPMLAEPLLQGTSWTSTGGARGDVTSACDYAGSESITVPAFPAPVAAARVRCELTQAGALGDPYGSGLRTVWWVRGVGPVKVEFDHGGGPGAPVTIALLQSTNQTPAALPGDVNYFPLKKGLQGTYRWTNTKHFAAPEVESYVIDQVVNGSARISVHSISGPIKVAGAYGFTTRLDGVTNIWGLTKAVSRAKLPPLGPTSAPVDKRRHFFTPFDLITFGFNPVIPAYPATGGTWSGVASGRDYGIYGVTGKATVVRVETVKVAAGTFQALVVRTTLKQPGFPFGSGTRTSWFAPAKGLVKLVYQHGDGSVSTVELIK